MTGTTGQCGLPVVVAGAGVVGVMTARALAARGISVILIDTRPGPAQGCSQANAGILAVSAMPMPGRDPLRSAPSCARAWVGSQASGLRNSSILPCGAGGWNILASAPQRHTRKIRQRCSDSACTAAVCYVKPKTRWAFPKRNFNTAVDMQSADLWTGLRPSTPSGPPYLGRVQAFENLWINAGHGQLGWTMSLGCAAVVSALIAGEPAPVSNVSCRARWLDAA